MAVKGKVGTGAIIHCAGPCVGKGGRLAPTKAAGVPWAC